MLTKMKSLPKLEFTINPAILVLMGEHNYCYFQKKLSC